jgi:hypothetical protein
MVVRNINKMICYSPNTPSEDHTSGKVKAGKEKIA